jgi:hypothetical protein
MNTHRLCPFIFLLVLPVIAADTDPGPYLQTAASYRIYGGELGDPTAPTPNDKKVAFSIEGNAARQIFDAIGPDQRDPCTEGSGMRVRHKDHEHLTCTLSKQNDYACSFGFDLITGKSIGGSIC